LSDDNDVDGGFQIRAFFVYARSGSAFLFHEALRAHVGPVGLDVVQALLTGTGAVDDGPTGRNLDEFRTASFTAARKEHPEFAKAGALVATPYKGFFVYGIFVTVLSLPYVIERLVPQPAAAVDGDPATKVEEPTS
jgi:hypothetical protein